MITTANAFCSLCSQQSFNLCIVSSVKPHHVKHVILTLDSWEHRGRTKSSGLKMSELSFYSSSLGQDPMRLTVMLDHLSQFNTKFDCCFMTFHYIVPSITFNPYFWITSLLFFDHFSGLRACLSPQVSYFPYKQQNSLV